LTHFDLFKISVVYPTQKQGSFGLIQSLLKDTEDFKSYEKYRRLLKQHPQDSILKESYLKALAHIQISVSKKHNHLKRLIDTGTCGVESTRQKNVAEQLLKHWGIYMY